MLKAKGTGQWELRPLSPKDLSQERVSNHSSEKKPTDHRHMVRFPGTLSHGSRYSPFQHGPPLHFHTWMLQGVDEAACRAAVRLRHGEETCGHRRGKERAGRD